MSRGGDPLLQWILRPYPAVRPQISMCTVPAAPPPPPPPAQVLYKFNYMYRNNTISCSHFPIPQTLAYTLKNTE